MIMVSHKLSQMYTNNEIPAQLICYLFFHIKPDTTNWFRYNVQGFPSDLTHKILRFDALPIEMTRK